MGSHTGSQKIFCSYNIGILSTIYVNPGFIKALHKPSASQQGLITAIYYLGTWLSYVFLSHQISDSLGRRWAAFVGVLTNCVGVALQTSAGVHGNNGYVVRCSN